MLAVVLAACEPPARELRPTELWATIPSALRADPVRSSELDAMVDPGSGALAATDGSCRARLARFVLDPCRDASCAADSCSDRLLSLRDAFAAELGAPSPRWRIDAFAGGRTWFLAHVDGGDERVIRLQHEGTATQVPCGEAIEIGFLAFDCGAANRARKWLCETWGKTGARWSPASCAP